MYYGKLKHNRMSTRGIKYNGIKYLYLIHPNDWKKKSLEDNIYFTI
jgi:hypothetical protein